MQVAAVLRSPTWMNSPAEGKKGLARQSVVPVAPARRTHRVREWVMVFYGILKTDERYVRGK